MSSSSNNQSKEFSFRELNNDDTLTLRLTTQEIVNLDRSITSQYRVLFWPAYKKIPESHLPDQYLVNSKGSFTQIGNSSNYNIIIDGNRNWFRKTNVKVKEDAGWYRLEYLQFDLLNGSRKWKEVKTYTVNIFHPLEDIIDTTALQANTVKPTVKHQYVLLNRNKDYILSIPSYLSREKAGQLSSSYTISWFASRAELSNEEQNKAILEYLNEVLEKLHNSLKTQQKEVKLLPWPNDLLEEIINLPGDRGRDIYPIQVGLLAAIGRKYPRAYGVVPGGIGLANQPDTPNITGLESLRLDPSNVSYLKIAPQQTIGNFQKFNSLDEIESLFTNRTEYVRYINVGNSDGINQQNRANNTLVIREEWTKIFTDSLLIAVDNLLKNKRFKELTGSFFSSSSSSSSTIFDDYFTNSIVLPRNMLSINTVVIAKLNVFGSGSYLPQQQEVKRVIIQISNPADVQVKSELPSSNINKIIRYNGTTVEGNPVWYKFNLDNPFFSLAGFSFEQLINKRIQQRSTNAAEQLKDLIDEDENGVIASNQQSLVISRDITSTGIYLQFANQTPFTKRVDRRLAATPLAQNLVDGGFNQLRFPVSTVFVYNFGNRSTINIPPLRMGSGIYKIDASPYYDSNKYDVEWKLPFPRFNPERVSIASTTNQSTLIYDHKNPILHIGPVHRYRDFGTYTLRVVTKNPGRLVYEVYFNVSQQQLSPQLNLIPLQNGQKQIASQFTKYYSTKNKQLPNNASTDEFNLTLPHHFRYALALYNLMSYYGGNLSQRFQIIIEDLRVKLSLDRLFRPPYLRYLPPNLLLDRDRQYILYNPLNAQWEFFQLTQVTLDIYKGLSLIHPDKIGDKFHYDLDQSQDLIGEHLRNAYKANIAAVSVDTVYGSRGGNLPDYYRQKDYGLNRIGYPIKNPNYLPSILSTQATRVPFFSWVNSQSLLDSMTSQYTQFTSALDVPIELILIWLREFSKAVRSFDAITRTNYGSIARQVEKAMEQTERLLRVEVLVTGKDSILRGRSVSSQLQDAWSTYRNKLPSRVRDKIYTSSVSKILSMIFQTQQIENDADRTYSRLTNQFIVDGRQSASSFNINKEGKIESFRENEYKAEKVDVDLWRYLTTLNDLFQGDSLSRVPGKLREQDYVQFLDEKFTISIILDPTKVPLLQTTSDIYRDTLPIYHSLKSGGTPAVEKNNFLDFYYSLSLNDVSNDVQQQEQSLYNNDPNNQDNYDSVLGKTNQLNQQLVSAAQSITDEKNEYNQQVQQNPNIIIPQNQNQPVVQIPQNQAQLPVNVNGIPFNIVQNQQKAKTQQVKPFQLLLPQRPTLITPGTGAIKPLPQQYLTVFFGQDHKKRIDELILELINPSAPDNRYIFRSHASSVIGDILTELTKNPSIDPTNMKQIIENIPEGESIGKKMFEKGLDAKTKSRVNKVITDLFTQIPVKPQDKSNYYINNFINAIIVDNNGDDAGDIFVDTIEDGFINPNKNPQKKANAEEYVKLFNKLKSEFGKVNKKYFIDPPTDQMINDPVKSIYSDLFFDLANAAISYDNGVNKLLKTTEKAKNKAQRKPPVQYQQLQKYGFKDGDRGDQVKLINAINFATDDILTDSAYYNRYQGYGFIEPIIKNIYNYVDTDSVLKGIGKSNIDTAETLEYINYYTIDVPKYSLKALRNVKKLPDFGILLNNDPYTMGAHSNLVDLVAGNKDKNATVDGDKLEKAVKVFKKSINNALPIKDYYNAGNIDEFKTNFLNSVIKALEQFDKTSRPILDKYAKVNNDTLNDYIDKVSKIKDNLLLKGQDEFIGVRHGVRIYENGYISMDRLLTAAELKNNINNASITPEDKKFDIAKYVKTTYDDSVLNSIDLAIDGIDLNKANTVKQIIIAVNEMDLLAYDTIVKRAGPKLKEFNTVVKKFIDSYQAESKNIRAFKITRATDIVSYVNSVENLLSAKFYNLDKDISDVLNSVKVAISTIAQSSNQTDINKIKLDATTDISGTSINYSTPKDFDNTSNKNLLELKSNTKTQLLEWDRKWPKQNVFYSREIKSFAISVYQQLFGEAGLIENVDEKFGRVERYLLYMKYREAIGEAKRDSMTNLLIKLGKVIPPTLDNKTRGNFVNYLNRNGVLQPNTEDGQTFKRIVNRTKPSALDKTAVVGFHLYLKDAKDAINKKVVLNFSTLSTETVEQTLNELNKIMLTMNAGFVGTIKKYNTGVKNLQAKKLKKKKTVKKPVKKQIFAPPKKPQAKKNNNAGSSSSSKKTTPKLTPTPTLTSTKKPQIKKNNNAGSSSSSSSSSKNQPTVQPVLVGTTIDKLKKGLAELKRVVDASNKTKRLFGSPTSDDIKPKIFTSKTPLFTKTVPKDSQVNLIQFEENLEYSSDKTEPNTPKNTVLSLIRYVDVSGNLLEVNPSDRSNNIGFLIEYLARIVNEKSSKNEKFAIVMSRYISSDPKKLTPVPEAGLKKFRTEFRKNVFTSLGKSIFPKKSIETYTQFSRIALNLALDSKNEVSTIGKILDFFKILTQALDKVANNNNFKTLVRNFKPTKIKSEFEQEKPTLSAFSQLLSSFTGNSNENNTTNSNGSDGEKSPDPSIITV